MSNILDYIDWRGDLSFDVAPLCEVDHLIFAELSYLELEEIVPSGFTAHISFSTAVNRFLTRHAGKKISFGAIVPDEILLLAEKARDCRRFGELRLCGYQHRTDEETQIQFAAMTFFSPGKFAYCAFRGTDDTLVGWKEDLNLSYLPELPSQRAAADYATLAAEMLEEIPAFYLGGHSKGGNLAIFAAVKASDRLKTKLVTAFGGDSPGFSEAFAAGADYKAMLPKICHIIPASSVVGMLLHQEDAHITVRSSFPGLMQHDGFSWLLKRDRFLRAEGLTEEALRTASTLRLWIDSMSEEEREDFSAAIYEILHGDGKQTLTQLADSKLSLLKAFQRLSPEARHAVSHGIRQLLEVRRSEGA